ncbi:hypothetical protein [Paenibacillus roseipurpureus]|uniref:Uncharacterized protein n=1 Tax=Paenibacillus roseopurpureus TaxID=2918901 RepID=A0AA96LMC7_9BACL|nr:hypothetical protein [Paenibacillus sp. MBLB1832]WNR43786.1 hypothetical protein MJB10_22205 [Paenibacillus sp. MBLB1832]
MYAYWTNVWNKVKPTYHRVMHAYHSILYRDCIDADMKQRLEVKVSYHLAKMKERA